MLPRNAARVADMVKAGRAHTVVVSFVGNTDFRYPTVYADSGRDYDWSFLSGACAILVVKPGVDCRKTVRALVFQCGVLDPLPMIADPQTRACGTFITASRVLPAVWDEVFT